MRKVCATTLCCLALLTAGVASADVLVTTDGTVVETKGPWQQRGKMVVFTLENGRLSALRAEDVDFEATARWRQELEESQPMPAAPVKTAKARIVLTDADVGHVEPTLEPQDSTSQPDASGETEAPATSTDPDVDPATQSPVRVTAWEQDEPADGRGRRVFGTLRNDGNSYATDISVEITAYDSDGVVAGTVPATPVTTSLRPGESTTFSAQFTEVYIIGATRMRVSSLDLELGGVGEEAAAGDL